MERSNMVREDLFFIERYCADCKRTYPMAKIGGEAIDWKQGHYLLRFRCMGCLGIFEEEINNAV
jgi:hypothetical protein